MNMKEITLERLYELQEMLSLYGGYLFRKYNRSNGLLTTVEYVEEGLKSEIEKIEKEIR